MSDDEPVDLLHAAEERGLPTEHRWGRMREWLNEQWIDTREVILRHNSDGRTERFPLDPDRR